MEESTREDDRDPDRSSDGKRLERDEEETEDVEAFRGGISPRCRTFMETGAREELWEPERLAS